MINQDDLRMWMWVSRDLPAAEPSKDCSHLVMVSKREEPPVLTDGCWIRAGEYGLMLASIFEFVTGLDVQLGTCFKVRFSATRSEGEKG